jgi:EAL and modified HD-GYP domain-containing signal transduction protein
MTQLTDSVETHSGNGDPVVHLREFFLARQPILDTTQSLIAYELLFRSAAAGPANVTDDLLATASVMANAAEMGMENVVGSSLAFVNVDVTVLMSDFVSFLPHDKVILEILETVKVTPEVIARVEQLAAAGFRFALDDVIAASDDVLRLLPVVEIIKVDIRNMAQEDLELLSHRFKLAGKKLLAEKVETIEEFENCVRLGFDYFQGYYFAKPVVLVGRKLSPSQLAIMQLMELLRSDADGSAIERAIKQDASMGLNLLRMVNSPWAGLTHRVDSLSQAVMVLGRRQLQRWLQILLYAEPNKSGRSVSPLLMLATTRGKLLELMADQIHPGNRGFAERAFTVGIMSLMDALFGQTMQSILDQIGVADEVSQALLARRGPYGEMLKLAEYIERIEVARPLLVPTLRRLGLSIEQLNAMQLAAFEWSNSVASGA